MRKIIVLAATAALAACGKTQSGPASPGGSPGAVAPGGAVAAPAGLPAWAAPMSGAPLETAMAMPSGNGILAYHVDAKPDDVVAFYDAQATAGGLRKITQSPGAADGGTGAIYSSDPPGGDASKRLSVTAAPENGRTRVDVTYKPGA